MQYSISLRLAVALTLVGGCNSRSQTGATDAAVRQDGGAGPDAFYNYNMFDFGCAAARSEAKLKPVTLVMMLDNSGSMGDGINGQRADKWDPVTAALKVFFAEPVDGVSASLAFFPNDDICNPSAYYFPAVPSRPLPESSVFAAAMDAQTPHGHTPTLPVMQGAISYAKDALSADPKLNIAIVLITDGEPDSCDSSVSNVAFEAAKAYEVGIPTYVIGVGLELSSLNEIAVSGGTMAPTLVSVGDPQQTQTDFLAALDQIRGLQISCNYPIPATPPGQTFDFEAVNVLYTPTMGDQIGFSYNHDCAGGIGWRYDDSMHPKSVELCPSTCSTVKADRGGKVEVVFGCATIGDLIQ